MRSPLLALALVLVACSGSDAPPGDAGAQADALAPDAGPPAPPPLLRDDQGGALVLRGTNIEGASKSAPDHLPRQRLADFVRLRDELGLDAIRLLVFWEAIEPTRGGYDDVYLAAIADIARQASDAGLFVVVDMHQDVFGVGFGFHGAPRWACDESLYASFVPPMGSWGLSYFTPEVEACFDRLYTDPTTIADFGAAWARLARELRDVPGVLAYELLNEPPSGTASGQTFERTIAPPFYEALIDAIRAEDPRPLVFFGPTTGANAGLHTSLVTPARPRLVYAPHLYDLSLELGNPYTGNPAAISRQVAVASSDASRLGVPFAFTELGVQLGLSGGATYLRDLFDALDAAGASALQWEIRGGYDLVDDTGAPTALGLAMARPYPARTAGTPRAFSWDAGSRTFVVEWDEGGATGDTIVMTPSVVFPSGFDATLDDGAPVVTETARVRIAPIGAHRRLTLRAR